jgi:hypothetical protein
MWRVLNGIGLLGGPDGVAGGVVTKTSALAAALMQRGVSERAAIMLECATCCSGLKVLRICCRTLDKLSLVHCATVLAMARVFNFLEGDRVPRKIYITLTIYF